MLIEVDDKIIASDVFEKKFVCDLSACKGACCVEGDEGAPLKTYEIDLLESVLDEVRPYMTEKGLKKVDEKGVFYIDEFNEPVTMLVEGGACAFANFDSDGTAKCGIEKAHRDGKIDWKKPISCELYPIRAKKYNSFTALNYEQIDICKPACECGDKLNVSIYRFLKAPLVKAYGEDFFNELVLIDKEIKKQQLSNE